MKQSWTSTQCSHKTKVSWIHITSGFTIKLQWKNGRIKMSDITHHNWE